jgi:hypothetical protein
MATIKESVSAAAEDAMISIATGKKWYVSKTFWVNTVAALAMAIQVKYGFIIGAETQAIALSAINLGLRAITKESITF